MKDGLKKFLLSNWTPGEKSLLITDVLLFGILVGWLTSPFRSRWKADDISPIDLTINCEDAEEEEEN
jgi:hypothetical protein